MSLNIDHGTAPLMEWPPANYKSYDLRVTHYYEAHINRIPINHYI